jgi:exopolysaccharide production protein ExoZ
MSGLPSPTRHDRGPAVSPTKTVFNLQLARAIAALLVVYAHIGVPGATCGHFGVDIFFVISGFIMTLICTRSPQNFFSRRLVRIGPLYWLITGLIFLLSWWKPELVNSTQPSLVHLLKSIFFVPYVKGDGLIRPMLDVGWTLEYEMYFYTAIALALLAGIAARHATLAASALLVVLTLIFRITLPHLSESSEAGTFASFYSLYYVFEFVLGVFVFYLVQHPLARRLGVAANLALAAACLVFLVWHQLTYPVDHALALLMRGVPAMLFVAALLLLEQRNFVFTRITLLGDASYALYLSNQFVVEGLRKIATRFHVPFYSIPSIAITLVLSSLVGIAIYLLLEKPLHDRLRILVDGKPAPR